MSKSGAAFKKRLLAGETLFGTHTSFVDFTVTELFGNFGYDYVWLDTEHSAIDYQEINAHILAAQSKGLAAIVRIPFLEPFLAKRVLEMGPDGIIFPMIDTPHMARDAMAYSMYPPRGIRGFGAARAWDYGTMGMDAYLSTIDDTLCRFIQIEHKEAVDNLDEILKVPYVDGYIIGPMDLSGSIGELGNILGENTLRLVKSIVDKVKAAGKAVGISVGDTAPERLKPWADLGIQFISAGGDVSFIKDGSVNLLNTLRQAYKK
ncbi:MAG: 4-hydroxy-3-methylbut-2-en-1-yl diphosphate synthase [Treponema sp.]|jgi:2-dehydro-3-deoxyglucarate aldolase/4-hydroxy-2-oxoheptanedioate aldolase|nr:4-hydroxy-3-methylbut-2-en-1-yl diphosphate synthase [Treponema sp.]